MTCVPSSKRSTPYGLLKTQKNPRPYGTRVCSRGTTQFSPRTGLKHGTRSLWSCDRPLTRPSAGILWLAIPKPLETGTSRTIFEIPFPCRFPAPRLSGMVGSFLLIRSQERNGSICIKSYEKQPPLVKQEAHDPRHPGETDGICKFASR